MDETNSIGRLKRRADFLHVGKGRHWHGKAMSVQTAATDAADAPRVGFTLTRKVGCAVVRNRARRRLKEAVRLTPNLAWRPGNDYVIVGRIDAIRLPFEDVQADLDRAIRRAHDGRPSRGSRHQTSRTRPERTS